MPSRNIVKIYAEDGFYHVYNRGVNKQDIFLDAKDYSVFLNLLKRYLDSSPAKDPKGREYDNYFADIDLLAFCLMPNHFHLFLEQRSSDSMTKLLRSVTGAYTIYFNKKYKRVGPLFQSRYKASLVNSEAYFSHISRYIHRNPHDFKDWEWSSFPYYLVDKKEDWLKPDFVLGEFDGPEYYNEFVESYKPSKEVDRFKGFLVQDSNFKK